MTAEQIPDPARQPDNFPDPARAAPPPANTPRPVRSHDEDAIVTGKTSRTVNPRTWSNVWGLRQATFGVAVLWLMLLIVGIGFMLEYALNGLISGWVRRAFGRH